MSLDNYPSWGRYPDLKPAEAIRLFWRNELPELDKFDKPVLPYAYGKSYGDSCQNEKGILLDTKGLNKFIEFDEKNGTLKCETGVTLATILDFILPRGFFLNSTPGTKLCSLGGAIANDVHGKNHHKGGTFGRNLNRFELVRSDGERLICSENENTELFKATIGGLGLTGLITWAEFRIKSCPSEFIAMESLKFDSLEEFFEITAESDTDYEYTVSWIDCTADGGNFGRGLFSRGNHADPALHKIPKLPKGGTNTFPFDAPFINSLSVNIFNSLYFNKQLNPVKKDIIHYDPFFYPLDAIHGWNKAYGKNGFLQYQFVIPFKNGLENTSRILKRIVKSGMSSFLTVLKTFGDIESPGMLSFPRPGITMAIDFRMNGRKTLDILNGLDELVRDAGGAIYPAKDARMSADDFKIFYPEWKNFSEFIDPKFSSSFWRRVSK